MITATLTWLGMIVVAQRGHGLLPAVAPGNSLDQKLVGVWTSKSAGRQTEVTYLRNHKYISKWGRDKFKTGFYQENGRWEILSGDRVQWIPDSRKNKVLRSDRKLTAEVRAYEKAMDEGAWKPLPRLIEFTGRDTFSERMAFGKSKESIAYFRVKPRL